MRAIIQRVNRASVIKKKNNEKIAKIGNGLAVLLGICKGDDRSDVKNLANKIINLRCFEDNNGKMNLSLVDVDGDFLSIPQFTLCSDCNKGRRPGFNNAADPNKAENLYKFFNNYIEKQFGNIHTGKFGKYMEVELINDGPVTFILDSNKI